METIDGRRAVVRNGYLPEREIVTAVGPVPVQVLKVRDRSGSGIKFNSTIVPPYTTISAGTASFAIAEQLRYRQALAFRDKFTISSNCASTPAKRANEQHIRRNPTTCPFAIKNSHVNRQGALITGSNVIDNVPL